VIVARVGCSPDRTVGRGESTATGTGADACSSPQRLAPASPPLKIERTYVVVEDKRAGALGLSTTGPRPHDLRHACATLLIRDGSKSLTEIAEQLGNSVGTLSKDYADVSARRRRD